MGINFADSAVISSLHVMASYILLLVCVGATLLILGRSRDCLYSVSVIEAGEDLHSDSGSCSRVLPALRCLDLQAALLAVAKLEIEDACVTVNIPPGQHLITVPVHFGSTSVQLISASSSPPTLQCNYTFDVDQTRIFDPEYVYVDYTMYFNRSEHFLMENLELLGCPYPLRLDTVNTVAIKNSNFQ